MSSVPNSNWQTSAGVQEFLRNRKCCYFFIVTTKLGVVYTLFSHLKVSLWEQDCLLTRLVVLPGSQTNPWSTNSSKHEIIIMDYANGLEEQQPKNGKRGRVMNQCQL